MKLLGLDRLVAFLSIFAILPPSLAHPTQAPTVSPGAQRSVSVLVLQDGTPVRLRINRTISSADARTGDQVDFEVLEDVRVNGVIVIAKGATALGTVTAAEAKKRMGRGGRLDITIDSVRLIDSEKAALRAVKEGKGGGHTGAMTAGIVATSLVLWPAAPFFLMMHGKDFTIPKDTEITAYVNGDMTLNPGANGRDYVVASSQPVNSAPVAVTPTALALENKTVLQITSSPVSGADIELDGKFVGQTPSRVELSNGDHILELTMNGFAPWRKKLDATGGAVTVNAQMNTSIAGVEQQGSRNPTPRISDAGGNSKESPLSILVAREINNRTDFGLTLEANMSESDDLYSTNGDTQSDPPFSNMLVTTKPDGAEIDIDGQPVGQTPLFFKLGSVRGAARVVTIRKEGYITVKRNFTPDGQDIRLSVVLARKPNGKFAVWPPQ